MSRTSSGDHSRHRSRERSRERSARATVPSSPVSRTPLQRAKPLGRSPTTRLTEDMVIRGTRIDKMGRLADFVRDKRMPLEMCLSSNVQTAAAKSLDDHPFPVYFRNNLPNKTRWRSRQLQGGFTHPKGRGLRLTWIIAADGAIAPKRSNRFRRYRHEDWKGLKRCDPRMPWKSFNCWINPIAASAARRPALRSQAPCLPESAC